MDPFVSLQYGIKKFKSNTIKNGGLLPEWNQLFQIPLNSEITVIQLKCMDEDLITNDLVGSCDIVVADLIKSEDILTYHPYEATIYYKNKESG